MYQDIPEWKYNLYLYFLQRIFTWLYSEDWAQEKKPIQVFGTLSQSIVAF